MDVKLSKSDLFSIGADVVWFGVFEKEESKEVKKADFLLHGAVFDLMKRENFKGNYGEVLAVQTQGKCWPKKLIVAGCMADVESAKIKQIAKHSNSKVLLSLVTVWPSLRLLIQVIVVPAVTFMTAGLNSWSGTQTSFGPGTGITGGVVGGAAGGVTGGGVVGSGAIGGGAIGGKTGGAAGGVAGGETGGVTGAPQAVIIINNPIRALAMTIAIRTLTSPFQP